MSARTTTVGPFTVLDLSTRDVIHYIAGLAGSRSLAFALHVGGLNHRGNPEFVRAMRGADAVYADGIAVVAVGRASGGKAVRRAATTDIGIPIIQAVRRKLGRPVRLGIIGGTPGTAIKAAATISKHVDCVVVGTFDGFRDDYESELRTLTEASPDVLIVGMGMPREALWINRNLDHMPNCLILTCGGWLGFLSGDESRAPSLLRMMHLEWLYRAWLRPRDLLPRYAFGMRSFFTLMAVALYTRARSHAWRSELGD